MKHDDIRGAQMPPYVVAIIIACLGIALSVISFWLSHHPMHDVTDFRWFLLVGGIGFTGFLVIHFVRLHREMQRHAKAKQALTDANRALLLLEQSHKRVNQEKNEVALFEQICSLVVNEGGYRFAWCGLVEENQAQTIIPVAYANLAEGFLQALGETWNNQIGQQEPARSAVCNRIPIAWCDIPDEPQALMGREQAIRYGYASSLAIPLLDNGNPFAVFNLYSQNPMAFHAEEIDLLTEVMNTLAFGILSIREFKRRKKAEKELAHHRNFLEEQVAKRTRLMNTVAAIAQRLLFHGGWKHNIDAVLQDLGMAANVSRAYVYQVDKDLTGNLLLTLSNEWIAVDVVTQNNDVNLTSCTLEEYGLARWQERLLRGECLYGRVLDFPEEERNALALRGILSLAIMPILVNETFWGFLGFEDYQRERTWGSGEIDAMQLAVNTLDAAIRKDQLLHEKRADEAQILKLSTAVEQSPNIVFITDAQGHIEYVNPKFTEITGYAAAEALGTMPRILQPQAKTKQVTDKMWLALKRGDAWREEFQNVKKDGSQYWVHASLSPLVNDAGEITHFVCIQEDVTHRKHSELQLRTTFDKLARSENRLQAILDNMPSIIFLKDISGNYVLANRLFVETFQLDAQRILGHKDVDLFPDEVAKQFMDADREVLQRGLLVEVEMMLPVGHENRIFHVVRFPVVADDSGYFSICGIATDITERKIAQARLLRSKKAQDILNGLLFAAMEHSVSLRGFIQSSLGRILSASWFVPEGKGAIYLFGVNDDGSDLICQIGLNDLGFDERIQKARSETVWAKHTSIIYIRSHDWPNGVIPGLPERWGYYSAPLSSEGHIKGVMQIFLPPTHLCNKDEEDFLATVRNTLASIVEKKIVDRQLILAKENAESASRAKSTFLANMSHEVRTPMNGVIGMLELLGKTRMTPMQRQYLAVAAQSAELQMSVINDILDFSKIEAGRLVLEQIPFDPFELIENIGSMLSGSAHSKGLELAIQVSNEIKYYLLGDAVRLRQVLINLVGNAIKFTSSGEITIRADLVEENATTALVRFHVIDTGIGIASEAREKIFQPFVQADDSTTRKFGGTGLGLVIARQIVEAMGGRMGVASQAAGGSVFWFEIEFVKASKIEFEDLHGLEKTTILIVDDNDTNRMIMKSNFHLLGIACHSAAHGEEALRMLRDPEQQIQCDIAILDMHMPGMGGLELACAIKQDAAIAPIKLLLLSSGGHPEEKVLHAAGIAAYIMKPAGLHRLIKALKILVDPSLEPVFERQAQSAPEVGSSFNGKILLVEDTFVNQQVAAGMLKQMGLEVEIAKDGQEGVSKAITGVHDVILMDMQMPVMDGLEATQCIRAWEKEHGRESVPILAMTANALSGDRERCLEAGMNDYLAKPVLWDVLLAKLAQWLPGRDEVRGTDGVKPDGEVMSSVVLDHHVLDVFWQAMKAVPGTFTMVIEEFLSSTPGLLEAVEQAAKQQSPEQVYAAAHALKSNSATVGALALAELCATMEQAARQGDVEPAVKLIKTATESFHAAVPDLKAALARE
ncbi:MAG: response regulator [Magnetococcus sp. YQC-5]